MKKMIRITDKIEKVLQFGGIKKDIVFLVISGICVFLSLCNIKIGRFDLSWISIFLCGLPILVEATIGLITKFDIKADVLVSIALIASLCIGEIFAAGEVAFIMQLGTLLEDLTVNKAEAGIERLVKLTPQTARLRIHNEEKIIDAVDVKIGDIIKVLPGETIPIDGTIIKGNTSIDQAIMTGESMPVDKKIGDEVYSGTVNQFGSFEMRATRVGEDSSIQRMIQLVKQADASKAKIVGLADRWATWIVIIALLSAGLTWVISGEIIRAVTILVVFCPCSLVLATPTAIMAGIGNATKHSFLVRKGDALERLAKVTCVVFDKTGTLTYGTPKVIKVKSINDSYSDQDVYQFIASIEQYSEHPIAKAIIKAYQANGDTLYEATDFKMLIGKGVSGKIGNLEVIIGKLDYILECQIQIELEEVKEDMDRGFNISFLALNHTVIGYIVLSDQLRNDSKELIMNLNRVGIQPILLTGDNECSAHYIADELKIQNYQANCLPEDKLNYISNLQKNNKMVCMVGDGINDAPALKQADVGIAMGGIGSDIVLDASDIVLIDDQMRELPHLFSLSKQMMFTIRFNLIFSMLLNFLSIVLAIVAVLDPVLGALVHNCGSVFVIIHSALLLRWRKTAFKK